MFIRKLLSLIIVISLMLSTVGCGVMKYNFPSVSMLEVKKEEIEKEISKDILKGKEVRDNRIEPADKEGYVRMPKDVALYTYTKVVAYDLQKKKVEEFIKEYNPPTFGERVKDALSNIGLGIAVGLIVGVVLLSFVP